MTSADGPLSGIRVVDFTSNMSGPFATMILGDQGADVIKVEPPTGDILRYIGTGSSDVSAYFGNLNRSKRSIAIDLTHPAANQVTEALLDSADVVVQNFRPGVDKKLGLDGETVRTGRPKVVYVQINGFGSSGPYGGRPAYDHVVQALSGFASRQAVGGEDAAMVRQGIIDKATGLTVAQAITAALLQRVSTGTGRQLEIQMLNVAVAVLWPDGMMNHTLLDPTEIQPAIAHTFRLTTTRDGQIAFVLVTAARMKRLAVGLGLDGADQLPDSGPMRVGGSLIQQATQKLSTMTTSEAVDFLASLEVPVAPVVSLDELHAHPQIVASDSVDEFDHPAMGRIRQANPPVSFNGERAAKFRPAPHVGQDSAEVVRELGFDSDTVAGLFEAGVLHQPTAAAASKGGDR
jgi:crotonobetainyl-CoA:carnitine CoA-transferase CaiB-like acyl-CoA transferase